MRDLAALPKAHLHIHLEGAMRPSTLADFAREAGAGAPPTRGFTTFQQFVQMFDGAVEFIRTREQLVRVVREVVEDAALSGAVWIEVQANPMFYVPRFGTPTEVMDLLLATGQAEAVRLGIGFGLMPVAIRSLPPADAEDLAQLAAGYAGRGVVSFGLAADESLFPPAPFERAFDIAREAGLMSTPHAGELLGPDSVVDALDKLGARRIQHGVRAVEDPELVARLAAEGVVLDVCPTSNVELFVVPEIGRHPLPALLQAGVRCSINGDDPLLFGPGLLEEYETARTALGLTDEQLADIAISSLEGAAAPAELVVEQVARVRGWLATPALRPAVDLREYLRRVPKTELHCHVVSTIRPARLLAWADERGVDLPTHDLDALFAYDRLEDFLVVFNAAHAVFRTPEDLATVAYEGVADAVAAANLRYREHYVNPDGFTALGFDYPTLVDGLIAGLRRAEEEFGVGFGIVPAIDRSRDLDTAAALVEAVLAHPRPEVVGIGQDDLAASGLESPTDWAPVYARAAAAGLRLTAHVGEIPTSSAASVIEAWDVLGLDRVDHGYHLLDDPRAVAAARERGIPFAVTPVSATVLSGWPLDAGHPVARMVEAGLAVNLSTDDQTFFRTDLAREFEEVGTAMGVGVDAVERLCLNGVDAAFCDDATKDRLRAEFRAQLADLRAALDA